MIIQNTQVNAQVNAQMDALQPHGKTLPKNVQNIVGQLNNVLLGKVANQGFPPPPSALLGPMTPPPPPISQLPIDMSTPPPPPPSALLDPITPPPPPEFPTGVISSPVPIVAS